MLVALLLSSWVTSGHLLNDWMPHSPHLWNRTHANLSELLVRIQCLGQRLAYRSYISNGIHNNLFCSFVFNYIIHRLKKIILTPPKQGIVDSLWLWPCFLLYHSLARSPTNGNAHVEESPVGNVSSHPLPSFHDSYSLLGSILASNDLHWITYQHFAMVS